MSIFGPPDISKLIEKKDITGLNKALKYKDPNIVRDAAFALADLGIYASMGLLIGLASPDWQIRRTAYTKFAKFKEYGVIPLLASLHDPNEIVRSEGLTMLFQHKDMRAILPFADCMLHDPSKNVREASVYALFFLAGEQALEYFLVARNDPDPVVKLMVDDVLSKLGY